jgi:hypothetical protein
MVQRAAVNVTTSPWTDPDVLADLLDYFRKEAGYKVTPGEYALAQDLVLALIARGENIDDPACLGNYLAPVLCTTPEEQANFSAHFARWSARTRSADEPAEPGNDALEREVELAGRQWRTWRWIIAAVAVCVGVAGVIFWWRSAFSSPSAVPGPAVAPPIGANVPPVSRDVPLGILVGAGLAFFLAVIAWGAWWYLRGRLFLKRRATVEEPDLVSVKLDSQVEECLDHVFLRRTARELRRRYRVISTEFAIAPTVEQTVRNNGRFTPVLDSRQLAPEYFVLIDRKNFRDHNARYIDELLDRLRSNHVHIERYYFDADPRTLIPVSKRDPPLTLGELQAKGHESRVLLFTDAAGLFNPVSGEMDGWTEALWRWPHLAVLTPRPREMWGFQEAQIARHALVMPALADSLVAFARHIAGARLPPRNPSYVIAPLPAELVERPMRWLEKNAPETDLVEDVLESVRRFLGEDGYLWLSACAVYPEVHFNLTLYLGTNLRTAERQPLFNTERLTALFRLPWLKYAYIPDWLRLQLVTELSRERNAEIREVLYRLWLSVASGSTKPVDFQIAHKNQTALSTLTKLIYRRLARQSSQNSPLRDYVFASVMLGRNLEPLSVRVPRIWREFFQKRGLNGIRTVGETAELGVAIFICIELFFSTIIVFITDRPVWWYAFQLSILFAAFGATILVVRDFIRDFAHVTSPN